MNRNNSVVYELNSRGSFRRIALAKTKEVKRELEELGYLTLFTPELHSINCWVLVQEQAEGILPLSPLLKKRYIKGESDNEQFCKHRNQNQ